MRNLAVTKTPGFMKTINILAFVVMMVMNYLANALPINGKTTGELSAQYPNLFVPAGITFSIWGIIYLLLMVVLVLQFRSQNQSIVTAIGWAFAISSLLNAAWIVAWHYEKLFVSLIIILGMLLALAYITGKYVLCLLDCLKQLLVFTLVGFALPPSPMLRPCLLTANGADGAFRLMPGPSP